MDAFATPKLITLACVIAQRGNTVLLVKDHQYEPLVWGFPKKNRSSSNAGFRGTARGRLEFVAKLDLDRGRFRQIRHKLTVGNRLISVFSVELTDPEVQALPEYRNGSRFELKMFELKDLDTLTDLSENDRELIRALK
jgi:hypothetical protein